MPVNAFVFLLALRRLRSVAAAAPLALLALALLLHGLALLVAPMLVTAYWLWPLDAFHGRLYAATFLTPAVGVLVLLRRSSPVERLTLGLTLMTLGALSIVGVVWTSLTVPLAAKVDYRHLGTWVFFAMNLLLGFAGCLVAGTAVLRARA